VTIENFRRVRILNNLYEEVVNIDGNGGNILVGSQGNGGDLVLHPPGSTNVNDISQATIHLDGALGNISAGGHGRSGDLVLHPPGSTNVNDISQATIHLDSAFGNVWAGGHGTDGDLVLHPPASTNINDLNQASIYLDGAGGNIWAGGHGIDGDLALHPHGSTNITDLNQATIHLDGATGDIILRNADCAEEFDISESEEIEPGDVVILDDDEDKVRKCYISYDKKVAGIFSGAGDYRPGIVFDRKNTKTKRIPIALMGKVYCKVTAEPNQILVGDILTTSDIPGYAMKALDPLKAFGAIIGKAMKPLRAGKGVIPVLVSLQ
jgi:hypothetical protein